MSKKTSKKISEHYCPYCKKKTEHITTAESPDKQNSAHRCKECGSELVLMQGMNYNLM